MKNLFLITFIIAASVCYSQENDKPESSWDLNTSLYFYLIPEDFFLLPIVKADKDELHLEARYNYEDSETFSGWLGYNFFTGGKFEVAFTPMIGGIFGQSNGIAPGMELDLIYENFEFYTEAEYFFNFEDGTANFFYLWSELTYSPLDWLWFGIVGQRTRVYQTELEIQRGLLIGAAYEDWEFGGYVFNIFNDDPFVVLSLAKNF
ncbi:MAG TPA: hypothetical protein VH917_03560 [Ignavibacteriaceae bacterium]|jgi:hypothetical protein